ncbi:hypothetical protein JAO29_16720 [Edaphobacter sp. HDX4]|uniref:hypothetical protein n=1 Tax=Edaphobacter sp. HDX4 TaxID=2794064 RepID=UPI002FE584B2
MIEALGVRREPAARLDWPGTGTASARRMEDSPVLLEDVSWPDYKSKTPLHLTTELDEPQPLPAEEIERIARLMLVSIVGYFVAGWVPIARLHHDAVHLRGNGFR